MLPAVVQHPINASGNRLVDSKEISPEQNYRNDHNQRGGLDFPASRERDFPHFIANVCEEIFCYRGNLHELATEALLFPRHCCCLCHFPTYLKSHQQNVAGAEGFEPPSPVLETGSLTVELTPLKPALSNWHSAVG